MLTPFLMKWLIDYIQTGVGEKQDGLLLVFGLVMANFIAYSINEHVTFIQNMVGVRSTNVLNAIIYEKLLRISSATNKTFNQGEIINFVEVDAQTLFVMSKYMP